MFDTRGFQLAISTHGHIPATGACELFI